MSGDSFGVQLGMHRRQRNLSLRALADKTGLSFTYLSKLENNILPAPSDEALYKLADALELDSDILFQGARRLPADLYEYALTQFWRLRQACPHGVES